MPTPRIFATSFASVYPLYLAKVERNGRTKAELDQVIGWLTGYDEAGLAGVIADGGNLAAFFDDAPAINPNAEQITGLICGYRVELIEDPLLRRIRQLDKLVDELARGKKLTAILRGAAPA